MLTSFTEDYINMKHKDQITLFRSRTLCVSKVEGNNLGHRIPCLIANETCLLTSDKNNMVMCRQGHLSLATFSPSNPHPHLAALLWRRNFAREEAVTMTTSSTGIAPPPTRHVSTKVGYVTTQRILLT